MPSYEYKCKQCTATVTVSRGINDVEKLPFCGACNIDMSKVYSTASPIFRGSGFYSKDK
jgi:putative FmdB family regulatory protein